MDRKPTTVRLSEDLIARLDEEADKREIPRGEYIRQILDNRHQADELEEKVEELRDRLDAREQRIDELENQLARRSQIEDRIEEMALEVRKSHESDAPFFIQWYRWWRERG